MNEKEELAYQEFVRKLAKPGQLLVEQMTPRKADTNHMIIGLLGEVGELAGAIKKYTMYNEAPDLENILEEMGDVEFYLTKLREIFGITRRDAIMRNMAKLQIRYKDGYSDESAIARDDKVGTNEG